MRRLLASLLFVFLAAGAPRPGAAHPADEANVYHYLWVETRPAEVELQHATVVGGLLVQAVWPEIDRNGDDQLSEAEQRAYAEQLAGQLRLRVEGRPTRWELADHVFPSKEEFFGRNMAAITLRLRARLPKLGSDPLLLTLRDDTFSTFPGVFPQPVIKPGRLSAGEPLVTEDGRVLEFQLAAAGVRLEHPLKERPGAPGAAGPTPEPGKPGLQDAPIFPERGKVLYAPEGGRSETSQLKDLLHRPLSPMLIALGLGAALLAGMVHALSPGHGKSMVAAYLVGTRGTAWDAVVLGIVVTITHTLGVYVLGFLCLWLTRQIRAEIVGHWLSLTSGLLVLGMGFWLFQRGLLAYHGIRPLPGHTHGPGGHSHGHGHSHGAHSHSHEAHSHSHERGAGHEHAPDHAPAETAPATGKPPSDAPLESYSAAGPAADRSAERRGLIWLGIAGGIVPCFDALAILIAAVNLRRIEFGLALIAAFSVGMALVLVAIGILFVKAKSVMERFTGEAPWVKALPAVSGAVLALLGAWLTFQSLVQAGVLNVG